MLARMALVPRLPPTSTRLADDAQQPYFLWWCDLSIGQFRRKLREGTAEQRAYWLGALLREANTRDVWLFTSVAEIRERWPHLYPHLGRARGMWSFLLQLPPPSGAARVA